MLYIPANDLGLSDLPSAIRIALSLGKFKIHYITSFFILLPTLPRSDILPFFFLVLPLEAADGNL